MAIILTYKPQLENKPLVYIAGGFETDCEDYRKQLLHEVLHAAGLENSAVDVFRLESGKPYVRAGCMNYSFSVSHSKGFIVVALALCGEVGIDTEIISRSVQPSLLRRIRSAEYPDKEEGIDALSLWTLKEAFLKMTGKGLRHAMKKVHISMVEPHIFTAESNVGEQLMKAELLSFVYRNHRVAISYSAERIVTF